MDDYHFVKANSMVKDDANYPSSSGREISAIHSLLAIAERLDKQNELLERITKMLEQVTDGDHPMENSLNIYIAGDGR